MNELTNNHRIDHEKLNEPRITSMIKQMNSHD